METNIKVDRLCSRCGTLFDYNKYSVSCPHNLMSITFNIKEDKQIICEHGRPILRCGEEKCLAIVGEHYNSPKVLQMRK